MENVFAKMMDFKWKGYVCSVMIIFVDLSDFVFFENAFDCEIHHAE